MPDEKRQSLVRAALLRDLLFPLGLLPFESVWAGDWAMEMPIPSIVLFSPILGVLGALAPLHGSGGEEPRPRHLDSQDQV